MVAESPGMRRSMPSVPAAWSLSLCAAGFLWFVAGWFGLDARDGSFSAMGWALAIPAVLTVTGLVAGLSGLLLGRQGRGWAAAGVFANELVLWFVCWRVPSSLHF